jgi:hypothetical protein
MGPRPQAPSLIISGRPFKFQYDHNTTMLLPLVGLEKIFQGEYGRCLIDSEGEHQDGE